MRYKNYNKQLLIILKCIEIEINQFHNKKEQLPKSIFYKNDNTNNELNIINNQYEIEDNNSKKNIIVDIENFN